jgi:SNF2 family DNA or RNA helicase
VNVPAPRKSLEPFLSDSVQYYDHQVRGIRWGARHKNYLLADDMGTGKSLQALTTFVVDVKRGWAETLLIVCPIILKGNWQDEIAKFTTLPVTILDGTPMERVIQIAKFQAETGPRILICHYQQVVSELEMLNALHFDCLILDEAHVIKGFTGVTTQAVLQLYAHRKLVLTGTPMLNGIPELFPLLHLIDPKAYPDYYKFVNRYCAFGGHKGKTFTGVKNEPELIERLHNVMLRRMKSEVLDLPEVNDVIRKVDLYEEQRELYNSVADDFVLPNPQTGEDEEIDNALTRFLRLKQICANTLPFNGQDISAKMDAALVDDAELIYQGEKLVIFTQFREVLSLYTKRLQSLFPDLPVFELHGDVPHNDRVPLTHRWTGVTGPSVLISMLQVGGIGLNLTASKNVSFIDELFVPGLNQQAIDRCHRIGADLTQPVTVRRYQCRNTIEQRIQEILRGKSRLITGIVETDRDWKRKLIQAMQEEEE